MMEFLTVSLNFTPLYFKTFAKVILEPTKAAEKIAHHKLLAMTHRAYLVTGLCIVSALWGLNAVLYRVAFAQFQIYLIIFLYLLLSIELLTILLWCAGFRANPRTCTRRAVMYIAGTFTMTGLLIVELLRFAVLLPITFETTPLCAIRSFDCLIRNYALIPYDELRLIEVWLIGIPSLIGFIYLLHVLLIVQRVHVIRFFLLMLPFFLIEQILIIPFLMLIDFIKSYGFM